MTVLPYRLTAAALDLSPRIQRSIVVAASPAAAAETVVCTLTVTGISPSSPGVVVFGFGAFTQGTDGTAYNLKLRQTGTSGTTLAATGVIEVAAAKLGANSLCSFDASPSSPSQVYVLTATHANASAASTYSAATLVCIVL